MKKKYNKKKKRLSDGNSEHHFRTKGRILWGYTTVRIKHSKYTQQFFLFITVVQFNMFLNRKEQTKRKHFLTLKTAKKIYIYIQLKRMYICTAVTWDRSINKYSPHITFCRFYKVLLNHNSSLTKTLNEPLQINPISIDIELKVDKTMHTGIINRY